jgi:hypothetical protein
MLSNAKLIIENKQLKYKIGLYEISTKSDYEKIQMLKDFILDLKNILKLNDVNFNIDSFK